MLTLTQKRRICKMLRARYEGARNIKFEVDGVVTATVDRMHNTSQSGRIFCGFDQELLREVTNHESN